VTLSSSCDITSAHLLSISESLILSHEHGHVTFQVHVYNCLPQFEAWTWASVVLSETLTSCNIPVCPEAPHHHGLRKRQIFHSRKHAFDHHRCKVRCEPAASLYLSVQRRHIIILTIAVVIAVLSCQGGGGVNDVL